MLIMFMRNMTSRTKTKHMIIMMVAIMKKIVITFLVFDINDCSCVAMIVKVLLIFFFLRSLL